MRKEEIMLPASVGSNYAGMTGWTDIPDLGSVTTVELFLRLSKKNTTV